ncbi:SDR family oxidoreductase [Conexibacter sp. SYSU D00693]|uniref:SDR family oxidoreductase n=1 Tax=Conexibacter sp. SYSU D00693 TaxID=2812560 RepID=UPI00196B4325|nr:SDR family oxidoreductase [Conexibacter sp. SYSU D00693]
MTDIRDKVVAITGASSGIGEATAELFAARGAKVVLGARREAPLRDLAGRLGPDAAYRVTDVRHREDVQALVDLALERHGRLDVLVNNAGVGPISRLDALRVEDWEAMVDVNLKGVLHGIAAALPVFEDQQGGHLVITSSTAAHRILPTMAVYAATKTAVNVVAEGLRQEAVPGVRVTVVSPGYVATNFADSVTDPDIRAQIAAGGDGLGIPPAAIARAIDFAVEQPDDVDVGEVVVRPTAQR